MGIKSKPTATRIDPQTISPETTVCHFDELDDEAKEWLLTLLEDQQTDSIDSVDVFNTGELTTCDVVKFVEYYDVDIPEIQYAD